MKICKVEGCGKKHHGLGYCKAHYSQIKRHGKIISIEPITKRRGDIKCIVEGCNNTQKIKGYCLKHYAQLCQNGEISNRTRFDKNQIIGYDNYAEIVLYNKDCEEVARTKIDLDDIEKCKSYKWGLTSNNYVSTSSNEKTILLHRFVMDCSDDLTIDHKDWDTLNNRKYNLRLATSSQQSQYTRSKNNSVKGVSYLKKSNRWRVRIHKEGIEYFLGLFIEHEDAIRARLIGEQVLFGEFSPQRHLFKEYNITPNLTLDDIPNSDKILYENKDEIIGVYKKKKRWISNITIDKKSIVIGRFDKKLDAEITRLIYEYLYFGENNAPQRRFFNKYDIKEENIHILKEQFAINI